MLFSTLITFEIPEDLPDMYLYAIKECETGNIKFGIPRKDPKSTIKTTTDRQLQRA